MISLIQFLFTLIGGGIIIAVGMSNEAFDITVSWDLAPNNFILLAIDELLDEESKRGGASGCFPGPFKIGFIMGWFIMVMFSILFKLPPKVSVTKFVLIMYLSKSSLAKLVRVEARDNRNELLMTLSADAQPPRLFGLVLAPDGGTGGM
jgi:hypothetical protein